MVLLMLPEFFFALFEKNGMHLETILTNFINVRFKRPAVRRYEIENLYEYEPEKPVTPKVKKEALLGKERIRSRCSAASSRNSSPSAKAEAKRRKSIT